jgi:hypothetical protein
LAALLTEVWASEEMPAAMLPRLAVSLPARSIRGYINYRKLPFRIVIRVDDDEHTMRNTLVHELAAVHRAHTFEPVTCRCDTPCV